MTCTARTLVWDPPRDDWAPASCWEPGRHTYHHDPVVRLRWEDGAGVDVTGLRELLDPADLPQIEPWTLTFPAG